MAKKWICPVCGYVHEGDTPPERCPQCKVPGDKFKEMAETEGIQFACQHELGVAKAIPDTDEGKYIEIYNNGDDPLKLKDVTIYKDESVAWTGLEGEVIMGHSFFTIVGAKGTTPRGISSGFSAKKSVLIELYDPNNNLIDKFQRGEKADGWGNQSLANNKQTWSRCPNGTGKFMIAPGTLGEKNPDSGEEDPTVVQ